MGEECALEEKSHQKRILPTEEGIASPILRRHTSVIANAYTFISNDSSALYRYNVFV